MARRVHLLLPSGFDSSLLDGWKETHGIEEIHTDEESSFDETESSDVSSDSQESSESVSLGPIVQDAPFLTLPDNILSNIANKLGPKSFVKFARSCRQMYDFCRQPTAINGVEIPLREEVLSVYPTIGNTRVYYESQLMSRPIRSEGRARRFFDELKNWPFSVYIRMLELENAGVASARDLLATVGARSIHEIKIADQVDCQQLVALVQDFDVRRLQFDYNAEDIEYSRDELEILLHMPFEQLTVHRVPSELLVDVTIPRLCVDYAQVTAAPFSAIIQKFMTTDNLIEWDLSHDLAEGRRMALGDLFSSLGQFLPVHVSYEGPLPQQRPLAFFTVENDDDYHLIYYIIRADGRNIRIENHEFGILTKYCPIAEAPAILHRA